MSILYIFSIYFSRRLLTKRTDFLLNLTDHFFCVIRFPTYIRHRLFLHTGCRRLKPAFWFFFKIAMATQWNCWDKILFVNANFFSKFIVKWIRFVDWRDLLLTIECNAIMTAIAGNAIATATATTWPDRPRRWPRPWPPVPDEITDRFYPGFKIPVPSTNDYWDYNLTYQTIN